MTFQMFGCEWDFLALVVFMFVMIPLAEMIKPLLKKVNKFAELLENTNWFPLILSWVAGTFTYVVVIHLILKFEITSLSIVQFAFFTLLINGGYKVIKKLFILIKNLKDLNKRD